MDTLRLQVDADHPQSTQSSSAIDQAARILREGGLVALPTETVYGLGANALNSEAVSGIFAAKQRPGWDPLIVHVADEAMLAQVVAAVPPAARLLIAAFWPGPLTLLLPRAAAVPDAVTAGRALVGVRMPAHPVALEVIRRAGVPIAAPSANRFGHTSPTTAGHVLEDLDGRIDAVLDAGPAEVGVESTVLDATVSPMIVYRPGAITLEQIKAVAGAVEFYRETEALSHTPKESLPSPGVGLRHYAPRAKLILVEAGKPDGSDVTSNLVSAARSLAGRKIGVMLPGGLPGHPASAFADEERDFAGIEFTYAWGHWQQPEELAHRLFAGMRFLDSAGCDVILCPTPPGDGIGAAIRDRLRKAAVPEDDPA
jgi:L-threonylcarbamoyladenylate synthase